MKLTVIFKAAAHLIISPVVVIYSHFTPKKIFYSTAMRHAEIVLLHIAKVEDGIKWKSLVAPNMSKIKTKWIRDAYGAVVRWIYSKANHHNLVFVNWGYSSFRRLGFVPEGDGFRNIYLENDLFGFGRDQDRPVVGYVYDTMRPYFDGRGPSDLERFFNMYKSGAWKTDPQIVAFVDAMRATKVHKYGQFNATDSGVDVSSQDLVVFGQVESDAAWVNNISSVTTNLELLQTAIKHFPNAKVFYKAHPKHKPWPQDQKKIAAVLPQVIQVDPKVAFKSLLVNQPTVFVNTSGTGLDAGLAGCKVWTAGAAFYAGWGATTDVGYDLLRRTNTLTFEDMLVVLCLQYSRYFNRATLENTSITELTEILLQG